MGSEAFHWANLTCCFVDLSAGCPSKEQRDATGLCLDGKAALLLPGAGGCGKQRVSPQQQVQVCSLQHSRILLLILDQVLCG